MRFWQVKVRFKAPLLEEYEFVDTPYVEIRKGLYLEFYDSKKPKFLANFGQNMRKS
jgi:hypothetical protein